MVRGTGAGSEEEAAPEGGEPFGGVGTPYKDAVVGSNAAGFEGVCEEPGVRGEGFVSPGRVAVAAGIDDGAITWEALEISEDGEQRVASHGVSDRFLMKLATARPRVSPG